MLEWGMMETVRFPAAPSRPLTVRPIDTRPMPCKVCGSASPLFGVQDFNRSCEEDRGFGLPLAGVPIYYRRCERCGLMFTDAFDDWTDEDFAAHIYNDGYGLVDPEFEERRPAQNARLLSQVFAEQKGDLDVLDYGGGNGRLSRDLSAAGFRTTISYDRFHPAHQTRPDRKYRLITCIETIEHAPNPKAIAADLASLLDDDGLIILGTMLQPLDIVRQRAHWWYVGPRNGHVTLFSRDALTHLWHQQGLRVVFTQHDHLQLICREPPSWARHVVRD